LPIDLGLVPQIGLDCAWKGDDWTCFHIRWGGTSLKHESYNGWSAPKIAFRLKELCQWAAEHANAVRCANGLATARPIDPKEIPCKIDDDATGGAVIALSEGYRFIPVGASQRSFWEERYPNKRSELWFTTRERAMAGMLDVSQLPRDVRERLRVQLLSVTWEPDAKGRRQVEKKDDTKEKINRSPDDADACNLSYSEVGEGVAHWVDPPSDGRTMGAKLGLFGRGQDASPSYRERSRPRTLGRR
ncbi:MAG: hypothetical protein ACJ8F7_13285, partial [Gemmataceae bacterium]